MPLGTIVGILLGLGVTLTPWLADVTAWLVALSRDWAATASRLAGDQAAPYVPFVGGPPYAAYAAVATLFAAAAVMGVTRSHTWIVRLVGAAVAAALATANAVACVNTLMGDTADHWTLTAAAAALIAVMGALIVADEGLLGKVRMPHRGGGSPS